MTSRTDALQYAAQRIAGNRSALTLHIEQARDHDRLILTATRRSFTAKRVVDIPPRADAKDAYDIMWRHIDLIDAELRCDEIRAVFDFHADERLNLFHIQGDEAVRIGHQMLDAFMELVRGDIQLRARVVDLAIALGKSDAVLKLIEQKQARAQLIADMNPADCEQLMLDLAARVERIRSSP